MSFARRTALAAVLGVLALGASVSPAKAEFTSYDREYVRAAQIRLQQLGYYNGLCDGIAGPATTASLMTFQRDNGIQISGLVNSATYDMLYRSAYYAPAYVAARAPSYYNYPTYSVPVAANGYYYAAPVASTGYTYATPIAATGYSYAAPLTGYSYYVVR